MEEAFAAYERVRARLPDVTREGACQRLADLDSIAGDTDVFLLDAFGVLNIGDTAIPGVPERVAGLQKAGKRVIVVSNAAGNPHAGLMRKYRRLGYDFDPDDVITSRKATLAGLADMPATRWGLMATESLGRQDLEHLDITYLAEDPSVYDVAEGFILMGSAVWTGQRQALLEASLLRNPRPVIVGNPDIVAPREVGFSVEPGKFAHQLADATGVEPRFFGKPFGNVFDLTFARLGHFDPARTVMVGDSLHTDILGGQAAGIKTALIAGYGFFAGHEIEGPVSASGIRPDYILERP
ncbi:HAD-IIA family hydrolase [Roseobacter ponti]|nr:HAD hydrolase-like protein [Roseobacter ponti]